MKITEKTIAKLDFALNDAKALVRVLKATTKTNTEDLNRYIINAKGYASNVLDYLDSMTKENSDG